MAQVANAGEAAAWHTLQSRPLVATWFGRDAVPCAPLVPSLVYDPLWQESHRLVPTAVWFIV